MNNIRQEKSDFWQWYYEHTTNALPSKVLSNFLKIKKDLYGICAIDIGTGSGSDSKKMLQHGATVLGIDNNELAKHYTLKNIDTQFSPKFSRENQSLEDLHLPSNQLVFTAKTLGFVEPKKFTSMMQRIKESIEKGGYFVGNFFGKNCGTELPLIMLSQEQVRDLFSDFTIISLDQREGDIYNEYTETDEHRQFRDIIAQKR